MFIETCYGNSVSDSNSISGLTRAWPCRPLHQLLGTVCILQTADHTVIAVKHLHDQQKPRHSKADHKKSNTDKDWLIKRFLLPHILCLLEHTTETAVTVSSWTTCATPNIIVEKQTKQTVFMPLWIWLNACSEHKLSCQPAGCGKRRGGDKK